MRNRIKNRMTGAMLGIALLGSVCSVSFAGIGGSLTISPTSISFADANPTTNPSITANSTVLIGIAVAGASSTQAWSVHGMANGDLNSATSSIPISNVSWTGVQSSGNCPSGHTCICDNGTMSKTTPVNLINGVANTQTGPGFQCTATFSMVNSWSYDSASYTQSFVITFTSP
ncbi:MAG: hypothetical protein PHX83_08620 [Acidobacteriia bacterium]|nr:hypothetical protein [Terriglobia bacterium]